MTIPPPGDHGGDVVAVARALGRPPAALLDLSASLNPVAPEVAPVISTATGQLGRYPDATAATAALAAAIGVDEDLLVLTNGGSEAIALVARLERVGTVVDPEFSLYRRHLDAVHVDAPRWRSNPSNPLGRLAEGDETARVWDEAFYPLATGRWTRGDGRGWRVGSLTKLWACPGLRIGYAIAPDEAAAAAVREIQPRWSVGSLALAVVEALARRSDLRSWAAEVQELRAKLVAELARRNLRVDDTDACWVLVHRPGLRDLLAMHGVLVRDGQSFGLPGVARVAVPDDTGRERLLAAVDASLR